MKIKLGDESWDFDPQELTLREAFAIKSAIGLNFRPFLNGMMEMDPDCLQMLLWLVRTRNGERIDRTSIDFPLAQLQIEVTGDDPEGQASSSEATFSNLETTLLAPSPISST